MNRLLASAVAAAILSSSSWAFADDKLDCISASEGAQKQREDRHLTKAREQFLVCSRDVCPGAVRKDCIEAMSDIDKRMPSVVVRAKDGKGVDLVTVSVTIDGKLAADTLERLGLCSDAVEGHLAAGRLALAQDRTTEALQSLAAAERLARRAR